MPKVPIILLAAGESSRMGSPKPLLPWKGQTLIQSQIKNLLGSHQPIIVVLGAFSDQIIPLINPSEVIIAINEAWKDGMSTSIAFGVKRALGSFEDIDGVIIATIDQPLVDAEHIQKLASKFNPGNKQIIVSESDTGWRGVPALFDRCYLEALTRLRGDSGAKSVVHGNSQHVQVVNGGNILVDMDTPEIYKQIRASTHQS